MRSNVVITRFSFYTRNAVESALKVYKSYSQLKYAFVCDGHLVLDTYVF